MNKICCIYAIKDKRNDKVIYIGQTGNFKKRKTHHFTTFNKPIDKYMFNEGRDNFEMYVLEELSNDITLEEMRKMEDELILKYNTIEEGLNKRRSGNISINNPQYRKNHQEKKNILNQRWVENHKEFMREYQREYHRKLRLKKKQEKLNIETL